MGLGVPEAAGVGADLVRQDDGSVVQTAELQLEVHQGHAAGGPEVLEEVVDLEGVALDGFDFLFRGQLQGQGVVLVQQGVPQIVVFIGELDGGRVEDDALLHAVALGEGPGGDVADNDLQGDDGDFFDHGFPLAALLHEVGGDPGLFKPCHEAVGHLVVDNAFARDGAFFQAVEGGGVVLVVHDVQVRVVGFEDLLGLAFVELLQLLHIEFLRQVR